MNAQLERLIDEYRAAGARLNRLAENVPAERWRQRPDPDRWSVGECIAHLNLTAEHYVEIVEPALETARERAPTESADEPPTRNNHRYRRDLRGWLLWKMNGPPVRLRVRTKAAFVPEGKESAEKLLADFAQLEARQIGWVTAADGLPVDQVYVASPFDARVRYSLFSCLSILPRHEHRHLWQAEQVAQRLR